MAVCFSKHELKLINNGFDHWSNNLPDRYDTTTLLARLHVTSRNKNIYKLSQLNKQQVDKSKTPFKIYFYSR